MCCQSNPRSSGMRSAANNDLVLPDGAAYQLQLRTWSQIPLRCKENRLHRVYQL